GYTCGTQVLPLLPPVPERVFGEPEFAVFTEHGDTVGERPADEVVLFSAAGADRAGTIRERICGFGCPVEVVIPGVSRFGDPDPRFFGKRFIDPYRVICHAIWQEVQLAVGSPGGIERYLGEVLDVDRARFDHRVERK